MSSLVAAWVTDQVCIADSSGSATTCGKVTARPGYAKYTDDILSHLPKLGVPMIMRRIEKGERKGDAKVWSYPGMEKVVQQMRKKIDGVSELFTLDACRHGGMTELEEAELTDGQGRALSGHKTAQAYRGYAKETMQRALAATRKRHAHLLAQKQLEQQNTDTAAARDETNDNGMMPDPITTKSRV
jgi:hypothetical protein